MTRVPASTYRLQLHAGFRLQDAAALADYLHALGADWFYLSPLLQAVRGSMHGYDVTDHDRVDEDRGGREGLERLAAAAREQGMGVLVDVVPNHVGVAVPRENPWWWSVLRLGRDSPHADAFDVEWSLGGRIRLPVLGESVEAAAAAGHLVVDAEAGELRYREHAYPLAPDSADDGADALTVHGRQHYELMDWRRADGELNYRRFFAVNGLAAIRVEVPAVFEASHREVLGWHTAGLVDGLRIDHPDGLADPGTYLDRLSAATAGAYLLVEKILEVGETLPPFWPVHGTTGYDALGQIDRVLVDPAGRPALDALDASLRRRGPEGGAAGWAELIHRTKRGIADGILGSEVRRLVTLHLGGGGADGAPSALSPLAIGDAMAELLACFPVYRSYLPYGREHLDAAAADALRRRPDLAEAIAEVHAALADPRRPESTRFQQTSGMVMAKGVEDTAFYRVSRLASLTEVGADPASFAIDVDEFHRGQQARHAEHPRSMTTLSTHDTKRGEDVRARISVISELPEEWRAFLGRRRDRLTETRRPLDDGALENLLWESIVGAWPREREALHAYAEKAARESGLSTNWADPDERWEDRMHALVDDVFDDPATAADVAEMVGLLRDAGWSNSLAAKLLQLTAPGVPDVYQGSELWETSLVDPDNRREVDFARRRELLARLDGGWLPPVDETGAVKLLVASRALRLRRDRPNLFDRYLPLRADGVAADHLVGFDRGGAVTLATRLPVGLARGGWGRTTVRLPSTPYVDVLTGRMFIGGELELFDLLSRYPVALLARLEEL